MECYIFPFSFLVLEKEKGDFELFEEEYGPEISGLEIREMAIEIQEKRI